MILRAFGGWLDGSALWQIGIGLLIAMALAAGLGHVLRKWRRRKRAAESTDGEGYVVSAVLGLLALLMGFTFSLAIDRFEARRGLVLEEANAIGTTYLRAQLLEAPHRARISRMLVDYTDNRIALAQAPRERLGPLVAINDRLITDLWTATAAAWPTIKGLDFSSAFLESMNAVIDLDAARKVARAARVPVEVFLVLVIYVIAAAGVLGYTLADQRGRGAAVLLILLLSMSLLLVIDIDRPDVGGVGEVQTPMLQLKASLAAQPPSVFDRPLAP